MNRSLFFLLLLTLYFSCTNDELPKPKPVVCDSVVTYTADIKAIIDNTCAYEGCHVTGFASGDFSSYDGIQEVASNGLLEDRSITLRNMPPSNVPSGQPESLTDEEITLMRCWMEGGFPE